MAKGIGHNAEATYKLEPLGAESRKTPPILCIEREVRKDGDGEEKQSESGKLEGVGEQNNDHRVEDTTVSGGASMAGKFDTGMEDPGRKRKKGEAVTSPIGGDAEDRWGALEPQQTTGRSSGQESSRDAPDT
ncbi:hypothetical protein NDU88_005364 [Pleurodeles waltl]|uniref:Uncharacterized protein n=1 Tax=Pleurodeles waltl TaxID=8319 RepID=A0AAV7SLF7_PLEWA|nr:hypothetical protein NDU88_005364 [Pleurodeles waltl]